MDFSVNVFTIDSLLIISVSSASISANTQQARDNLQQQLQQQLGQSTIRTQTVLPSIGQTFQQTAAATPSSATPIQPLQPIQTQQKNNTPTLANQQQQQQQNQQQPKKALSLTVCNF